MAMMNETMATLPEGFVARAPRMEELEAVVAMIAVCDIADTGEQDYSKEELRDDWQREHFNLAANARIVLNPQGDVVGYIDVCYFRGGMFINPNGNTLPVYRSSGIEQYLYQWAEYHAREFALAEKASGGLEIERMWTLSTSEHVNALLEKQGFGVVRREVEMEIEMEQEPAAPQWPNGINVRTLVVVNDAQNIHRIIQDSFSVLTGHCYQPFEQWEADAIHRNDFDPTLVFVAEAAGEIVGVAMGYNSESGGWIRQVAVERQWRGRGIALQLIRTVLGEFYRRGTRKVGLSVDPQNVTGALRVYERAGMHVRRQYYTYDRKLDVQYSSI